jgi:hypothetical protein
MNYYKIVLNKKNQLNMNDFLDAMAEYALLAIAHDIQRSVMNYYRDTNQDSKSRAAGVELKVLRDKRDASGEKARKLQAEYFRDQQVVEL